MDTYQKIVKQVIWIVALCTTPLLLLLSGCNNSSLREKEYAEYQQFTNEIMTGLLPYFPYASDDTMLVFENESGTHKDTLSFFKNERGSNVAQTVSISEYEPLYPGDYVGLFFHLRLVTIFHSVETKYSLCKAVLRALFSGI